MSHPMWVGRFRYDGPREGWVRAKQFIGVHDKRCFQTEHDEEECELSFDMSSKYHAAYRKLLEAWKTGDPEGDDVSDAMNEAIDRGSYEDEVLENPTEDFWKTVLFYYVPTIKTVWAAELAADIQAEEASLAADAEEAEIVEREMLAPVGSFEKEGRVEIEEEIENLQDSFDRDREDGWFYES